MKRLVAIFLIVALMPSLPVISQTINVSVTDWLMLRTELQTLKERLPILDKEIESLESSLQRARKSQQTSAKKIEDLQKRLAIAKAVRERFRLQVESLETQLTELGISLSSIQFLLDQNETEHVLKIEKLVAGYECRIIGSKILLYIVLGIAVGEGIYILADNLIK